MKAVIMCRCSMCIDGAYTGMQMNSEYVKLVQYVEGGTEGGIVLTPVYGVDIVQ
jgi:hypothetical protein